MGVNLNFEGSIDLIALYAAILSTAIAGWELYKWHHRNRVDVRCTPNMEFVPRVDDKTYIVVNVTNKGQSKITITHFLGYFWENRWNKFFKKNRKAFIVGANDIPKTIEPGEQWTGFAEQTDELERRAKEGLLYMGIHHSMASKEILKRVMIRQGGADEQN